MRNEFLAEAFETCQLTGAKVGWGLRMERLSWKGWQRRLFIQHLLWLFCAVASLHPYSKPTSPSYRCGK